MRENNFQGLQVELYPSKLEFFKNIKVGNGSLYIMDDFPVLLLQNTQLQRTNSK